MGTIFMNNGSDMMKGHLREPAEIPRLVFISKADVTLSWYDCVATAEWMENNREAEVELVLYETAMNCSMHRDDPTGYFHRVGQWRKQLPAREPATELD